MLITGKYIPITGHEGPRGMWMQGSTYTKLGWGMMASPTLGRLYPEQIPRYSFYRRLSGPQDQSGHEGVKKNLHPSDTWDRTQAFQPIAKRLAAWATGPQNVNYWVKN